MMHTFYHQLIFIPFPFHFSIICSKCTHVFIHFIVSSMNMVKGFLKSDVLYLLVTHSFYPVSFSSYFIHFLVQTLMIAAFMMKFFHAHVIELIIRNHFLIEYFILRYILNSFYSSALIFGK